MPSTRTLSITALVISLAALTLAVADFSIPNNDSLATPAAVLLPEHTLAQTINDPAAHDVEAASSYLFTGMQRGEDITYTHSRTGLTFEYPSDLNLYVIKEDGGEIIVGEKTEFGLAFQIFIQPWDEPGPLTVGRIRRDLPDMYIESVSETTTYHSNDPMLAFYTKDDTLGLIPQAWFIRNGYLYQVAYYAPPEDDPNPLSVSLFRGFVANLKFSTP